MRYLSSKLLLLILATLFLISDLNAQNSKGHDDMYWNTEENLGGPVFLLDTYQRLTNRVGNTGLDVYIKIAYDMLQFVRSDDAFVAALELNLSILDDNDKLVKREIKYLNHSVNSFSLTNSRKNFMVSYLYTELPPGDYRITVSLTDQESKRQFTKKRKIKLTGISENLDISDIILTNSTELNSKKNAPLYPLIKGRIVDPDASLYCFVDLFRSEPMDESIIVYEVFDVTGKEIFRDSTKIIGGENLSSYFLPIENDNMTFGKYKLIVKTNQMDFTVKRQSKFKINYHGLPTSIDNVDLAIRQLTIIAEKKDIKRLKDFPIKEKEKELVTYWDKHFPSPGESINGKMIEYYYRVANANVQFGNGPGGWKTDRGRILVTYGNPTNIEKHSELDNSIPYEIWNYNHLGKRFIFRDEHGFGDFRLVNHLW